VSPPRPADPARAPRLAGLDGVRFLAAAGVLVYHYTVRDSHAWGRPPAEMFPELGGWVVYAALGPELFFVISGFVILMTAWGRSVPDVVSSRVARLFPAYWTCVLLTGALLLWIWPGGKDVTGGQVALNLTMVQSLFEVGNVDGVYWTLWAELRFYALIVLLTAIGITRRRVVLFATLWPTAALVADGVGPGWLRTVLVAQYAPLFAAGMLLFVVHREGHSRGLWALVAANTGAAAWLVVPDQLEQQLRNTGESPSGPVLGLLVAACVALVAAVTLTRAARVRWRWLTAAGALTYPLYLIHEHWGWWVIAHVYPAVPPWVAFVLAAGFSLALAAVVHHGVERRVGPPLRRAVRRGLERVPVRASGRRRPAPAAGPRS
jgi:peptidoglycan/LPS O-acetylase OafA/YrhL